MRIGNSGPSRNRDVSFIDVSSMHLFLNHACNYYTAYCAVPAEWLSMRLPLSAAKVAEVCTVQYAACRTDTRSLSVIVLNSLDIA
jgi:hypothetical protein